MKQALLCKVGIHNRTEHLITHSKDVDGFVWCSVHKVCAVCGRPLAFTLEKRRTQDGTQQ